MVVCLNRRRGGVDGIYRCVIPDSMDVTQTIYIGVYTASTGEWHCALHSCWTLLQWVRMLQIKMFKTLSNQGTHKFSCNFNSCTYLYCIPSPPPNSSRSPLELRSQAKIITGGCLPEESAWMVQISVPWLKLPMTETTHKITLLVHCFFQHSACGMTLLRFDNMRFWCFCQASTLLHGKSQGRGFYPLKWG